LSRPRQRDAGKAWLPPRLYGDLLASGSGAVGLHRMGQRIGVDGAA
jgi:hypothetical protein